MSDSKKTTDAPPQTPPPAGATGAPGADPNPYAKLAEAWAASAKAAGDAMQQMFKATTATSTAASTAAQDPAAATAAAQATLAAWQASLTSLAGLQVDFFRKVVDDLPQAAGTRTDASSFSQLGRFATANWSEELRRLQEIPQALADRVTAADPQRLAPLMQAMVSEYVADLESLKGSAFAPTSGTLLESFTRLASGQPDETTRRLLERLNEAMAVKARYGAEYYADPDSTPVGQTPRELVYEQGKIQLYRYRAPQAAEGTDAAAPTPGADLAASTAAAPTPGAAPVLVVYSVINKPYILDLLPGYSFVEHLLAQGLDVYLIEWGDTEPGDRTTTLDSYIEPGISGCVDHICTATGHDQVSLFGHCIGGNLALLYAALHPERVARIITLTTPMTASEGGVVSVWTDRDLLPVDTIVDTYGHMPAKLIRYTFMALKPYYEVMKWKMFLEQAGNDDVMRLFLPVDRWANDNVDIPGLVFQKFIEEVFHDDRFRHGETPIHDRRADLKAITCPVMNLAASRDWVVPPASAEVLAEHLGTPPADYQFVLIEGAHVGILIDPKTRPLWTRMSDFLRGA